jgi:hypothetical protein
LNGVGLYKALLFTQLAQVRLTTQRSTAVFAEVDEPNKTVQKALAEIGMEQFSPPEALSSASVALLPEHKRPTSLGYSFVWFRPTEITFRCAVRAIELLRTGRYASKSPTIHFALDQTAC